MKKFVFGSVTLSFEDCHIKADAEETIMPAWITPQMFSLYSNFTSTGLIPISNLRAHLHALKAALLFEDDLVVRAICGFLVPNLLTPATSGYVVSELYPFVNRHQAVEALVAKSLGLAAELDLNILKYEKARPIPLATCANLYQGRTVEVEFVKKGAGLTAEVRLKQSAAAVWLGEPYNQYLVFVEDQSIELPVAPVLIGENEILAQVALRMPEEELRSHGLGSALAFEGKEAPQDLEASAQGPETTRNQYNDDNHNEYASLYRPQSAQWRKDGLRMANAWIKFNCKREKNKGFKKSKHQIDGLLSKLSYSGSRR